MKFVDEYRDPQAVHCLVEQIKRAVTRPWTLMEVCGGQTHSIVRFGIDSLLPRELTLLHGPGCPVCVTPLRCIDAAIELAARPEVILCSYGDMLRVPGSSTDLLSVKARGGDVRMVYSPLDALEIARSNPRREVVFFAVGFETTAPANAMAVHRAYLEQLPNFSVVVSHVLVPPALKAILSDPRNQVQAFLAAGHVCTVMGFTEYEPIALKYRVPIVVTGFEPLDILQGVLACVKQLETGSHRVENRYPRSVRREGNQPARDLIQRVFCIVPRQWRGIGEIEASGLGLSEAYSHLDACQRFQLDTPPAKEAGDCIAGLILRGLKKPAECPAFGGACTPETPLGATMVSSEGTCAAYFRYRRPAGGSRG